MASVRVPPASSAEQLRAALERSHYDSGGLLVALGGEAESSPTRAPVQARRLGDDDQAVLARLFLLGLEVDAARAARALLPAAIEDLVQAGFVYDTDGVLRSPLRITPFDGLLLAHDPIGAGIPEPDVVTGLNSAARTLAALTPRRPAASALDVGTGCGVQALLAARHCEHVVATDVNVRALDYTRLSAALSGLENVECREGSFFDPVTGEEFELVVCNPPYVISPDEELVYRDGQLERDEVSRVAVAGAARQLAEGGVAQLLCNWIHEPWEPWSAPLERWIEGAGCDSLLLHHISEDPLDYAAKWNAHLGGDQSAHGATLDRWLDYYAGAGIAAIATGSVALHRRPARGKERIVTEEMATGPTGHAGEHVLRMLDAADLLAGLDDDALLTTTLSLVDGHVLQQERTFDDGAYGEETVRLALRDNAGLGFEIGPAVGALLAALETSRAPADLVPALAAAVGAQEDDARAALAPALRTLVAQGVLVLAADV